MKKKGLNSYQTNMRCSVMLVLILASGCGGSSGGGAGANNAQLEVTVSSTLNGYAPRVTVDGMTSYALLVDEQGVASRIIAGVTTGLRSIAVDFYANEVHVATALMDVNVSPSGITRVSFYDADINKNFDADVDGWVNYAELFWGSDPLDPFSHPPTGDVRAAINAGGEHSVSSLSYRNVDMLGSSFAPDKSQSASYTQQGDMSIFY